MAKMRRSLRELAEADSAVRREEMERAVADGDLVIRSMTTHERDQSEARWAAAAEGRARHGKRRTSGHADRAGERASAGTGCNSAAPGTR
jgi:hypothetical protein